MEKKSFKCWIVGALILLGMLAGPAIVSAQTVPFDCTPSLVGVFTNRVYVQCTASVLGTVNQFAVSTSDSGMAARFLSAFTTAKVTAKTLRIHYFPSGDGSSFGCVVNNCRPISGVEVLSVP
jgi:hypothetical protein